MLVFVLGFVCSFILINYLSFIVYKLHLSDLQIQFRFEQRQRAVEAIRAGDSVKALVHRQNIVDTYQPESNVFQYEGGGFFDFLSVVQLYILEKIKNSIYSPKGERRDEGLERGKLAYQLEMLDLKLKAEEEWVRAVELVGYPQTMDEFKKFITELIEIEKETIEEKREK